MDAKLRIWLESDGKFLFGKGRAKLLEHIERLGSISAAARKIGMSYKHAWSFIKEIEDAIGVKLVKRRRGGAAGGGSELTPSGKRWLTQYKKFCTAAEQAVEKCFRRVYMDKPKKKEKSEG